MWPFDNRNCEENGSLTVVTGWHLHVCVCSLFGAGDLCELAPCMNATSIENLAICGTSTSACMLPAWQKLFKALLILARIRTGNLIPGSKRIPGSRHTSHSSSKTIFPTQGLRCLPNSSCLSFQHCEGDNLHWCDLLTTEIVKRMVLSQWSQADTCMCACALCSVLVINVNWLPAWTPHQLKKLAGHWTSTSACMLPAWQKLFNALLILARTGTCNLIPGSNRIPERRHTAASATKILPKTRFEVSAKLKLSQLSTLRRRQSSLIWPFAGKLGRGWFSHSGHWLTPACVPFLQYWSSIWTGLLHEHHINWQNSQGMEPAQVLILFQHGKSCTMLCSFLFEPYQATWVLSNRIPGRRQTAASTKQSSQNKIWSVCQSQAFSAFNIAKETLFIDLIFGEDGNWKENSSLTVVTGWHLNVCTCSLCGAGHWCELTPCMNATSNETTGKMLN